MCNLLNVILWQVPIIYGRKAADPDHVAAFGEPIELLEKFLEGKEWVAGDNITIADYSIVTTISHMEVSYNLVFMSLKKIKSVAYSFQGTHTGQLDLCNRLADGSTMG